MGIMKSNEIRETQLRGKGVFTNSGLNKGETIAFFGGAIFSAIEERGDHGIQLSESILAKYTDLAQSSRCCCGYKVARQDMTIAREELLFVSL